MSMTLLQHALALEERPPNGFCSPGEMLYKWFYEASSQYFRDE